MKRYQIRGVRKGLSRKGCISGHIYYRTLLFLLELEYDEVQRYSPRTFRAIKWGMIQCLTRYNRHPKESIYKSRNLQESILHIEIIYYGADYLIIVARGHSYQTHTPYTMMKVKYQYGEVKWYDA
jgi:hypothetical protein